MLMKVCVGVLMLFVLCEICLTEVRIRNVPFLYHTLSQSSLRDNDCNWHTFHGH